MESGETPDVQDKLSGVGMPTAEDLSYQIQQLVEQGVMTPEEAQTTLAQQSDLNGISTDPSLRRAQMDALGGLQDVSHGGLTASDESNLNKIRNDEATTARGARDSILQNAQSRGLGGSGLELMAQLQNQQSSATRTSQRDMDIAGQAQDRALQALISAGQMGGNIQNQDFNQQATVANANDAISKFNAQNQNTTNLANTQAKNSAQAMNLANKQGTANANAGIQTQQNKQRADVNQTMFNNQMARATGQQNVANSNAQIAGQNSQNQANANNQTTGTLLTAASMMSDERQKEDVEEFSPSDFLDNLTGYKYEYKDKKHGAGKQAGVMAQDLEKSEIGSQFVADTDEGKVVDYAKASPAMMAALADLNKRVKGMEGKDV